MIGNTDNTDSPLGRLSIDTFVATSTLFANAGLEDRAYIRQRQDPGLLSAGLRDGLALPPDRRGAPPRYYYGCLDFLPYCADGSDGFQLLEFNGTGMGGLTNLPWTITEEILGELSRMPAVLDSEAPLVVMPLSLETKRGLIHERVLVAQAIQDGLRRSHGAGRLWLVPGAAPGEPPPGPTMAIGYPGALRPALAAQGGRLALGQRRVHAAVRDLFCQHLVDRHAGELEPDAFFAVNALYPLCASKARTYALYNAFLARAPSELLRRPVAHWSASSREELVELALDARRRGLSLVIKPHASGAGRGVDFLRASQSPDEIVAGIDASIADAERSSLDGSARTIYPYVVCELLDGLTLRAREHPLHGHRYELRIVVYRSRDRLHAFPAICKLAGVRFDPHAPARAMLLNTVSTAPDAPSRGGHMLPLCNADTLAALGLSHRVLEELCEVSLRFVAYAIASTDSRDIPSGIAR